MMMKSFNQKLLLDVLEFAIKCV